MKHNEQNCLNLEKKIKKLGPKSLSLEKGNKI
jgi:hypothetical protein